MTLKRAADVAVALAGVAAVLGRVAGYVPAGQQRTLRTPRVVDSENAPSPTLLRSAGFVAEPGEYWTWRRNVD